MAEVTHTTGARTVVVALDATTHGVRFLESAAAIAERLRADLKAILVEDESLMRLADLPFAQEVNRKSGIGRALDAVQLNRLLRARSNQLQQAIDRFCASGQVSAQLQIVRGHYLSEALSATTSTDVLLLGSVGRQFAIFEPYRMARGISASVVQPKVLYCRSERGACHVLYDGTDAASRALQMAASLPASALSTLSVLIASDSVGEAARLRVGAGKTLASLSVSCSFMDVPATNGPAVVRHVRRSGCGLLIVPRGDNERLSAEVKELLEGLDCPVVLVG